MRNLTDKEALAYFRNAKEQAIIKKNNIVGKRMSKNDYNDMLIRLHFTIKDYEDRIEQEDMKLDEFIRQLNAEQDEIDEKLERLEAESTEQNENLNY